MKRLRINWRWLPAALVGAIFLGSGCQDDQIQTYRVDRLEPIEAVQSAGPNAASNAATPAPKQPSRIVAAIAQRPEAMWVFKMVGSPDAVSATEAAWRAFLQQVDFAEVDLPRWTVPDGWQELPGNDFRHATLLIPGVEPPLELAISRLPPGQDLLMNVNRWRAQLELNPLPPEQLESELTKIAAGDDTLLLFDASGVSAAGSPGGPMAMQPPTPSNADASSARSADSMLPFEFIPPDQWELGQSTQFTLRRFVKSSGERLAQIAITRLQSAGQSWADNVGVWCGELGIAALTADQVAEQTQEISIDGRTAKSIALKSSTDVGKASRIVCWTEGDESWFIKLTGDAVLVDESEKDFDQLLSSIRFAAKQ